MSTDTVGLKLLNRTKYAQNRTKYYTVRNTVLSQTERPFFVTGSFNDVGNNRKLLSLKKAFLNRRSSRRGPFQKLSLPHEYYKTLGDPLYYSHSELVSSCESASSERMCDSYFWKQICEKIREVRDVISINDLLKCVSSVVKVNHYDRDLFRVVSREFVDDVKKLSLEDMSELLHCYYRQNVYSCDLVNAIGARVTSSLIKELDSTLKENPNSESRGVFDKIKDIMPGNRTIQTDFSFRPLAKILKFCNYFRYSDSEFYLSVANTFLRFAKNMDFVSRLEMFIHLDPNFMFPESSESGASNSKQSSSDEAPRRIVSQLLDAVDTTIGSDLYHENTFELSVFLESQLFRVPENSKLLHDLCSVLSSCNLISRAIFTFISNSSYLRCGWRGSLDHFLSLLSRCFTESIPIMSRLSSLVQRYKVKSPFVDSLENMFMDSILTCFCALNCCWRLKLGCVGITDNAKLCKLLSFTLKDDNVHSRFLKEFVKLSLSNNELELISRVVDSINEYGCKGQSVKNLTSCFESLTALINNKSVSVPSNLREDISKANDNVSMEIIRQLVEFDRESLYRVSLSLSTSDSKNSYLEHYVTFFPKITRRSHERHHVSISNPFND